jgi:hypothetical protein
MKIRILGLFCFYLLTLPVAHAYTNEEIYTSLPELKLPQVEPDVIAFGDSIIFFAGTATGTFQAVEGPGDFGHLTLQLDANIHQYIERRRWSVTFDAAGNFDLDANIATNPGTTFDLGLGANDVALDGRLYLQPDGEVPIFAHATVSLDNLDFNARREIVVDPDWVHRTNAQIQMAFGVGLGRLYNISPRLHLLRLETMLQDEGVIVGAIPKAVGEEIMLAWYVLRNKIGTFHHMAYTFKILKKHGLLKSEPSISATYKFLNIFSDGVLNRDIGYDLRLSFLTNFYYLRDYDESTSDYINVALRLSYDHVFHIDREAYLTISPTISFTFRDEDHAFIGGRAVVDLPITFNRYFYDELYHIIGRLQTGFSARFTNEPDESRLRVSASYNFNFHRSRYYSIDSWVEMIDVDVFTFYIGFSYHWGETYAYFTTYLPLEHQLLWWPL